MKKFIALVLAVMMMVTCLAGCGAKGTSLADVEKAGKLVIATSPDFPPFEFIENGKPVGIEMEIMEMICEKMGVELVIENVDFDSILTGVQAGKYDAGVAGISVDPERAKNTLFTTPYCMAAQSIVVLNGSNISSKADLEGKKIAVQTGTTAEKFCMESGYEILPFVTNDDSEAALVAGKVDAWVIDDLTGAQMVDIYNSENPDGLVILEEAMTSEPYAFGFALGSDDLVEKINGILNEMEADGTVAAIFEKYNAPFTAPDAQ